MSLSSLDSTPEAFVSRLSSFVDEWVAPHAERLDRGNLFLPEVYRAGADLGLLELLVTPDGTLDLSTTPLVHESTEAISTHSPAVALQLSGTRLVAYLLARYAPAAVRERWLPDLLAGSTFGSFAITEPHAGTDVRGITTVARRRGGDLVLSGAKCWIGYAPVAAFAIVLAKLDGDERGAPTAAVVVDTSLPGVERRQGAELSGFRGMPNGELRFRDVVVPADQVLQVEGFAGMMDGLNLARIEAASYACGLVRGALEASVERAATRQAFGAPIGDLPSIQAKLGRMLVDYHAARGLTLAAATSFQDGRGGDQDVISVAKLAAGDMARLHTDAAMQVHAASGIAAWSRVERMHRDAKVTQVFDGTSEIHETMLGRRMVRARLRDGRLGAPYLPAGQALPPPGAGQWHHSTTGQEGSRR